MAKDETTAGEDKTAGENTTDTATDTGTQAPDTPATANANQCANGLGYDVETPEERDAREAKYDRLRALELACQPGIHEAKEAIGSVLARAEAYRSYFVNGETPGVIA